MIDVILVYLGSTKTLYVYMHINTENKVAYHLITRKRFGRNCRACSSFDGYG